MLLHKARNNNHSDYYSLFIMYFYYYTQTLCIGNTRKEKVKHISLTSSATAMRFLSELSYILVPFCSAVQTQP